MPKSVEEKKIMTERTVHTLDAKGATLGRLATQAATLLRGKHKVSFESHLDTGDFVTIVNAEAIQVTGNKLKDKVYYHHTNHPGGIRSINLEDLLAKSPTKVLEKAIYGMLPKNRSVGCAA
jgi:large subunit ribosomal protein L13